MRKASNLAVRVAVAGRGEQPTSSNPNDGRRNDRWHDTDGTRARRGRRTDGAAGACRHRRPERSNVCYAIGIAGNLHHAGVEEWAHIGVARSGTRRARISRPAILHATDSEQVKCDALTTE
jgi:hypothetical protein